MVLINTIMEKIKEKKESSIPGWRYFVCLKLIRWVFFGMVILAMYTLMVLHYTK